MAEKLVSLAEILMIISLRLALTKGFYLIFLAQKDEHRQGANP